MSCTLRLRAQHEALGARWAQSQGGKIPGSYGDTRAEWEHVRRRAGLIDLGFAGILRVTGRDRRSWLHGMVTNDVLGLADGAGTYAAILNTQGHMLSDVRIYAVPDALLLELLPATAERIAAVLDRYLLMEQAEIQDATPEINILSVQGPASASIAAAWGVELEAMPRLAIRSVEPGGGSAWIARVERAGEIGFDLWAPADRAHECWERLLSQARGSGGGPVGMDALNVLRVEAGIPWWGAELDESIVPFEARLEETAISFTKGCYIGQEIVARIHARGQVNNIMVGLRYGEIAPPPPGTPLAAGGQTVGRTATAVPSPACGEAIGLAFVRRQHAAPGSEVALLLDGQERTATVTELPFISAAH